MFLLTVKKKFIKELTVIGIVLTTLVAVVYHLFIPDRYFLWFPAIPIFFYLFGLFYIEMFAFNYRVGLECDDVSGVQGTEIHCQCHAADVLRICDWT